MVNRKRTLLRAPLKCDLEISFTRSFNEQRGQLTRIDGDFYTELNTGLLRLYLFDGGQNRLCNAFNGLGDLLEFWKFEGYFLLAAKYGSFYTNDFVVRQFYLNVI